jgi:glycosyltransferase involved in cell wall biosynthesis
MAIESLLDSASVSVIVAARNAAQSLAELLSALEAQTLDRNRCQVLIVDDCSTDETAALVEQSGLATLLRTRVPSGPAVARNVALRRASGDVLAITDADCRPSRAWLEHALADLDTSGADLIGGHIEVPLRPHPSIAELLDFCRYLDQPRAIAEGGFAISANLIMRRSVIDRIGLLNERLVTSEDREFGLRATEAGFKLGYSEPASVCHDPRHKARELARKCYWYGFGEALALAYAEQPRDIPRIWTRPGAYVIRSFHVDGVERLYRNGYRPSRLKLIRMRLGAYFLVQLPMVAGNFVGWLREVRARKALY